MLNKDTLKEWLDKITDALNEQVWFQELKGKWEELDPQSKTNLKFALCGVGVLSVLMMIFTSIWSVHSLKKELEDKRNLLATIQSANDEARRLRDASAVSATAGGDADQDAGNWIPYFENLTASAGFEKTNLTISAEKPGASSEQSKESLFDLHIKHVNIKNVVKYAFNLENGTRPIKVRNLLIDTKMDHSGYLDATLAVSAFALITANK
jgi:hypothetical protein